MNRKISTYIAVFATAFACVSLTVAPVSAKEKPSDNKGVYVNSDVDLNAPRVLADENEQGKFFNPCNNFLSAVTPLGFSWSSEFRWFACTYWGANDAAKKTYQWFVSPQSESMACAQVYHFKTDRTPLWSGIGCGSSGAAQVLWGQVAAYPKMKFKSLSGLLVPIYWN